MLHSCYSAVRGYRIYQDIREANYGELLSCMREMEHVYDLFLKVIDQSTKPSLIGSHDDHLLAHIKEF